MPRTEKGRATRRSRECNPAHRPIGLVGRRAVEASKADRRDARFPNSTSKPPRKGKQRVGPATGIERSNLKPCESVFDRKPVFDRCVYVPAVCEGASCGAEAPAKITGSDTSYEYLNRMARIPLHLVAATVPGARPDLVRFIVTEIIKHELFRPEKVTSDGKTIIRHNVLLYREGHWLRHVFREWFGQSYPWRWNEAASCYVDVRIDGKSTNGFDLTWPQAAAGIADETLGTLSTRAKEKPPERSLHECPRCFYETPVLAFLWLWLLAYLETEKEPHRHIPSNVYRQQRVKLRELLSVDAPRVARFYRECWKHAARANKHKTVDVRRDKEIKKLWPLVIKKCRDVPLAHRDDAIQACMERLVTVWDQYDPEQGVSFAAQACDWAIQDLMKRVRAQVQRSINLNDPADKSEDDDDKPTEPEQTDMMRVNALQGQVAEARRRLVAERLDCLNSRERRVIEGRLALNGYADVVSRRDLAAELGISSKMVRKIEDLAVAKLSLELAQ